ncbi:TRAP transporter small permease subunit [Amorphus sp. 3PC139-8]|uniref:TRAP transporter small permease subunit n=1 Tax=Amorphus sp. 3PC139-8 TaxID=2735676 RepID=UPI00345DC4CF
MRRGLLFALDRLVDLFALIGMGLLLVMAVHIFLSIGMRWFTGKEIDGTLETVTYYYMVGITFFPLALLAQRNGHLRADLFIGQFSHRHKLVAELMIQIGLAAYLLLMCAQTYSQAMSAMSYGEAVPTASGMFSVWPSRWFLPIGAALGGVMSLVLAAGSLARLLGWSREDEETLS